MKSPYLIFLSRRLISNENSLFGRHFTNFFPSLRCISNGGTAISLVSAHHYRYGENVSPHWRKVDVWTSLQAEVMDRYVRVKKIGDGSFGKALLVKKKSGVSREIKSDQSYIIFVRFFKIVIAFPYSFPVVQRAKEIDTRP